MTVQNTPAGSQAESANITTETQAVTTTTPTTPEAQAADGKQQISQQDFERIVSDLRKENASHRTKLKKFEEDEAKRTEAQLTEQQLLQKKAADLQALYDSTLREKQDMAVNLKVQALSSSLGIVDAETAALLIKPKIEYDENNAPKNIETLLKDLLKEKPFLAGRAATTTANGNATNPSRSSVGSQLSWDIVKTMSPEQYNARRPEIQAFLQANPPRRH